jgi:multiple sugar transport system permease protein
MGTYAEAAVPVSDVRKRRAVRFRITRDGLSTLVFLLPFLLIFALFSWFPILRAFVMSVQVTNLVSEPTFVGLENFRQVLADPLFGIAVRNTAWFALLALVFGFPIPIILSVLISETRRHQIRQHKLFAADLVDCFQQAQIMFDSLFDLSPTPGADHKAQVVFGCAGSQVLQRLQVLKDQWISHVQRDNVRWILRIRPKG